MGLLDDLLGGMTGQLSGRAQPGPAPAGGQGGGMSSVLVTLMPVVLAMLSNRGSQGGAPMPGSYAQSAGGGGLGDLIGQVLGGGRGAAGGGLGGLLDQLQRSG